MFKPATNHLDLGAHFFDAVRPADFGDIRVRYFNSRAAQTVGLNRLDATGIKRHFGRFEPLEGSLAQPLALRYHGHQFQVYNPDIGDGRGFLFAQCWETKTFMSPDHDQDQNQELGRLLDLGTKGSGITPYSRSGDGRLTLKGAVRELLATNMLAAQGVPTSRTFAIVEDLAARLYRGDEPSPARGAILTRLSHSHIRFGTFQRLAYEQRPQEIERLLRYCLTTYFHQDEHKLSTQEAVRAFYIEVVRRQALTVAAWMMAGFVHGVLNSDNMNITGESFDYGPWRWLPTYDGTFTAAYFDHQGLYAYGRQPRAVAWNLSILGSVLAKIHPETAPLNDCLQSYSGQLQTATIAQFFWRMGLDRIGDEVAETQLAEACLKQLKAEQSPFEDLFYASGTGQLDRLSPSMCALLKDWPGQTRAEIRETMLIDEVEALWAAIAERDDWQPLQDKIARLEYLHDLRCASEAPSVAHMEMPSPC